MFKKGRNTPVNQYSIIVGKDYINNGTKQNKRLQHTDKKSF